MTRSAGTRRVRVPMLPFSKAPSGPGRSRRSVRGRRPHGRPWGPQRRRGRCGTRFQARSSPGSHVENCYVRGAERFLELLPASFVNAAPRPQARKRAGFRGFRFPLFRPLFLLACQTCPSSALPRPFLRLSARISGLRSARSSPCIRHSKILSEGHCMKQELSSSRSCRVARQVFRESRSSPPKSIGMHLPKCTRSTPR
jgi:hypothetical protein